MPAYYVVGRDWPDHFYATNAKWPVANQWCWRPDERQKAFYATPQEAKAAWEVEEQKEARREAQRLKKELFAAILQRDAHAVKHLLKRNPLLLERHTTWGATPLGLAAGVGDSHIIALLLSEGANVAATDHVGATPLMMAALRGHVQAALDLLSSKQGGNAGREYLLRQATRRGETAVMAAAKMGHLDMLQALVGHGGSLAVVDAEGMSCLMMAAHMDRPATMAWLMAQGGLSPHRADVHGRTALMHAAAGGALQAVQLLLAEGPRLQPPLDLGVRDQQGYGPLQHACLGGNARVVEALVAAGLSIDKADPASLELMRIACRAGHVEVVAWLLEQGVGMDELVVDGLRNPMFSAVKGGHADVVDELLRAGARIDARDSMGRTPLGRAAAAGLTALCLHLVAVGASLLAADNHGHVPRRIAYLANQRETAEALSGLARNKLLVADDQISEADYVAAGAMPAPDEPPPPPPQPASLPRAAAPAAAPAVAGVALQPAPGPGRGTGSAASSQAGGSAPHKHKHKQGTPAGGLTSRPGTANSATVGAAAAPRTGSAAEGSAAGGAQAGASRPVMPPGAPPAASLSPSRPATPGSVAGQQVRGQASPVGGPRAATPSAAMHAEHSSGSQQHGVSFPGPSMGATGGSAAGWPAAASAPDVWQRPEEDEEDQRSIAGSAHAWQQQHASHQPPAGLSVSPATPQQHQRQSLGAPQLHQSPSPEASAYEGHLEELASQASFGQGLYAGGPAAPGALGRTGDSGMWGTGGGGDPLVQTGGSIPGVSTFVAVGVPGGGATAQLEFDATGGSGRPGGEPKHMAAVLASLDAAAEMDSSWLR